MTTHALENEGEAGTDTVAATRPRMTPFFFGSAAQPLFGAPPAVQILDNIDLYRAYCQDEGCFTEPRRFASDHTRYVFFHSEGRHPDIEVWNDTRVSVVVMSGLPGSGKDRYVKQHYADWPVVSLDDLREELDIDATENQGQVIQAARERAKEYLRKGERFVWNATNISRRFRARDDGAAV